MVDRLLHAYTPLIGWTGLGMILVRFLPQSFPRWLGRSLYWVGVPIEIFALARQTSLQGNVRLGVAISIGSILLGLFLGWLGLKICQWKAGKDRDFLPLPPSVRGSLLICSMLGNTGFVGLAIVPFFVAPENMSWAVLYSVTQNVFGTYGLGVLVSSFYSHQSETENRWWMQLKDLLSVPSLWGFTLGLLSRPYGFPDLAESILHASIWVVIPGAFILMGIRLSQINGWQSLRFALLPALLKTIAMPAIVGIFLSLIHLGGDAQLALVLMSGMPCAFAGLILSEEYNLDRDLVASSIIVSTIVFLVMIPIWLYVIPD
jgi:malate permease and related proteins